MLADDDGVAGPSVGDTITYGFRLTNTGRVTLTALELRDEAALVAGGPLASLAPGESDTATFTATRRLTQADLDAGSVRNSATARATAPDGSPVEDVSDDGDTGPGDTGADATVTELAAQPGLALVKTALLADDDGVAGPSVGDTITYGFRLTNTGRVTLTALELRDEAALVAGGPLSSLAPGESDTATFTATRRLTQADIDAGSVRNSATARATAPDGSPVEDVSDDGDTGPGDTGADATVTELAAQPEASLSQQLVSLTPAFPGTYDAVFRISLGNPGPLTLTEPDLRYDLAGELAPAVLVEILRVTLAADGVGVQLNPEFTGRDDDRLLGSGGILRPGDALTVDVAAQVRTGGGFPSSHPKATFTATELGASLTASVAMADPDGDRDGSPDGFESDAADRDGDGIPDAYDYDPSGYFYCEDDGRILTGGSITVVGPTGSNSGVGTRNGITILHDGSEGFYEWHVDRPGTYRLVPHYPEGAAPSTTRLSAGEVDVSSLLPANPAVLGSTRYGTDDRLADGSAAANPVFYTAFDIEAGDPTVMANNLPVTSCAPAALTLGAVRNATEGETEPAGLTLQAAQALAQDARITFEIAGTAVNGEDYEALAGAVTLPAGSTSVEIPVKVIDDAAVEPTETVVLTLTGTGSALLTLPEPEVRTATLTLADNDLRQRVLVTDVDLNATEDDDPAEMRFRLGARPAAPVRLRLEGTSQCSVSPSVLTFDPRTWETDQAIVIAGLRDGRTEGPQTCRPKVTVASPDPAYDGLEVGLSNVALQDSIADEIRPALQDALEEDLRLTFEGLVDEAENISQGALRRLRAGVDELAHCGTQKSDPEGAANVAERGVDVDLAFESDTWDCVARQRRITSLRTAIRKSAGEMVNATVTLRRSLERMTENRLRGRFWSVSASASAASGAADGQITGLAIGGGIYGADRLADGLFLEHDLGLSVGRRSFDLEIGSPDPISVTGDYRYFGLFGNVAISGEMRLKDMLVTPRVGAAGAVGRAENVSYLARRDAIRAAGRLRLQDPTHLRLYAGATFEPLAADEDAAAVPPWSVTPDLFCDVAGSDGDGTDCGMGVEARLTFGDPDRQTETVLALDAEASGRDAMMALELMRVIYFDNRRGSVTSGVRQDPDGTPEAALRLDWRF
ncbi:hypothetical protein LAZ40_01940 [Cereibacter sphaeroides]|nr:Calx-beta domain-containing protein [Cereibacter sphaeroides]MCE6957817.1 hypothetical protein [Cereibacter sphaeroides]